MWPLRRSANVHKRSSSALEGTAEERVSGDEEVRADVEDEPDVVEEEVFENERFQPFRCVNRECEPDV